MSPIEEFDCLSAAAESLVRFQKTFLPNLETRQVYSDFFKVFATARDDRGEAFRGLSASG